MAKKRKTTATTNKKKPTLTSLPYDLLLNCFARVSRLYYPILSLVSKTFRSLLASLELYKVRSLLGCTESCLYVCSQSRWYTLCWKPSKKKTNEYVLARVPIPDSPPVHFSNIVAVGSSIYNISSSYRDVWNLDCRSHTWCKVPSMRIELIPYFASVLDGKIYVAGWYQDGDYSNSFKKSNSFKNSVEVFDTKTQIWDHDEEVVAYNSKENRWDMAESGRMSAFMRSDSYCEIENVLYFAHDREIKWYDTKVNKWRLMKGLVRLPMFPYDVHVRLVDYGGKMAILWNERSTLPTEKIWCAVIVLKRRKKSEIWGTVEWFDHVLTVPLHDLVKLLAVTV